MCTRYIPLYVNKVCRNSVVGYSDSCFCEIGVIGVCACIAQCRRVTSIFTSNLYGFVLFILFIVFCFGTNMVDLLLFSGVIARTITALSDTVRYVHTTRRALRLSTYLKICLLVLAFITSAHIDAMCRPYLSSWSCI